MHPLKAIVLAAGHGERMRPLSDRTPKPLLQVHGRSLIEWHLVALAAAGVREVVVNTAWLEGQIVAALGDGARFGLAIRYSLEGRDHGGALETAGGIAKALPLLADTPDDAFWVVSADVFMPGFRFDPAKAHGFAASGRLAHLWLVPNPPYHPRGDFALDSAGLALRDAGDAARWTYANVALVRAALVSGIAAGTKAALGPLLFDACAKRAVSAELYAGAWENVGTPAQLEALNAQRA